MVGGQDPLSADDLPLRLLRVEDDVNDAELILGMLEDELPSVEVTVVRGLAGALLALGREHDVVLADLSLPDAHGLEVVEAIHDAYPDTAVVVLTGHAGRAVAMRAIAAGAGDCLVKGSHDARALATAVLYAVQRVRVEAQARRDQQPATRLLDATESPTCAVAADGTIVAVNAPWRAFSAANGGDPAACGVGVDYLAVCDDATGERSGGASEVADGLRAVLAGSATRFELDYPCNAPTEERWFSLRVSPLLDGEGAVVSHLDVTAMKLAERALSRQALHDPLTDLPNRALLIDRLEQALAEGSRSGHLVAVAFLDLDHFKRINDSLGHAAGDAVLVEVAERLALRLRDGDTLARFAGDEFVVVWRDLNAAEDANQLSERLAQAFEAPFVLAGTDVAVTASIGVSVDRWAQTADELLLAADAAMYDAKRRGPGRVRVFTPELRDGLVPRIRTEVSLRAAMYRDELVLHYQPVVDLTGGTVVGVEALVRWQHPTDGLLGPDLFIPVAEAGGLIVALGAWVMEQACAQAVRWHADGLRLDMAVNLSTRQVAHPDLVQTLVRVLRETGMDPDHLVLEVTESAVMEDAEAAATVFHQIAALGVSLAIDDFGTGYSSLVYLKRYPIGALKIDRSFIAGMGINDEDDAIIASVIGLARAVGGSCVAEGVETREQYAALHSLRCGYAQGWLFGRAVPVEELPELVAQCEAKMAALQVTIPQETEQRDQAAEQRDQAADQRHQAGEQRDQVAEQRDQVADQRDQVADRRDQVADQRDLAAEQRDQAAEQRDQVGDERDQVGDERDQAGDERDQAGEQSEVRVRAEITTAALNRSALARRAAASDRTRASRDRRVGASERTHAELDRDSALADRGASASERAHAEHDRDAALADRGASAKEREYAFVDGLTGAYLRAAGLVELDREIARARRTEQSLVLAFVVVDRLKAINDSRGHAAGDRLLLEVAKTLGAMLRSHDLIIRYGGDQFVCALSGLNMVDATKRIGLVNAALADAPEPGSVTVGLAELQPGDSPEDLVGRADAVLHLTTSQQRRPRA